MPSVGASTAPKDSTGPAIEGMKSLPGLNRDHYPELKSIFKGAAIIAATKLGPFQEFYTALVSKGIRPEMARLTLARKIAAIALIVWKKGVSFDAQHLNRQTAWRSSD